MSFHGDDETSGVHPVFELNFSKLIIMGSTMRFSPALTYPGRKTQTDGWLIQIVLLITLSRLKLLMTSRAFATTLRSTSK